MAALESDDRELASRLRAALDADTRELALFDKPLSLRLELPDDSNETALPAGVSSGDQLGPWRLERELGQGGMGQVWLATRDDGQYQLEVAIKLIDGVLDSDLVREQLRRERQILADLDHPNIARLLDGGIRDNGTPWYAMEYVHGLPLDQYCQQHGLSLAARLRLLAVVAQAVQHAHGRLVVHRDLKPGNILVDEAGMPHLLDFGIAKLLDAGVAAQAGPLTLLAAATPAYAAPEQLRGEQVDTAADIYALGVIAFELIVGTRPPQPDSESVDGDRGPLPSRFISDRRQRAPLRGDIDAIVSQALAPQSKHRYGSAKAMADDILRHLDGLPVEARGAGTGYRARKFVRRHWLGVGLGSAAVVLLFVALVFSIMQTRGAQTELARADAVQKFLLGVFGAAQSLEGNNGVLTQRDLADKASADLDAMLVNQPHTRIDLLIAVGRVYLKLGLADRARSVLQKARDELQRSGAPADDPRSLDVLLALGQANYYLSNFEAAIKTLLEADAQARTYRSSPELHATILYELGSSYRRTDQLQAALDSLSQAQKLAEGKGGDPARLPGILITRALVLRRLGSFDDAIATGEQAVAAARKYYGSSDRRTASAMSALGGMYRTNGNLKRAESLLRQAVAINREAYGQPQSASVNNLATVLQDQGRYAESGPMFQLALELASHRYGPDSAATASYRRNLALEQADAGQLDLALGNLQEAYARLADGHPLGSPENLVMRAHLARVLYQAGQPDEAGKLLPEIFADAAMSSNGISSPVRQAHSLSARLALDAGDLTQARQQLHAARDGLNPHGLETPDLVRLELLAGDIAEAGDNTSAARSHWQAALKLTRTKLGPGHTLAQAATHRLQATLAERP